MATSLGFLTNVHIRIQKTRVATNNREKHLEKLGKEDERVHAIYMASYDLERTVERYIAEEFVKHPVYPWTSKQWGCGLELAAKVVGIIENTTFAGAVISDLEKIGVKVTKDQYKEQRVELEKKYPDIFDRRSSIRAFDNISKLRRYAGRAPIDGKMEKVVKGEKEIHYNPELRMMTWRLLVSFLRQCRYYCPVCNNKVYKKDIVCEHCQSNIEGKAIKVSGVWYREYEKNKEYYTSRCKTDGLKIIPTPKGRYCPICNEEKEVSQTKKNCPDCGARLMAKEEPPGIIFMGHIDNLAKARTIRFWIDCLWIVWRQALGLDTRSPWVLEYGGHQKLINPWKMIDED
jgi:hypothetical protein